MISPLKHQNTKKINATDARVEAKPKSRFIGTDYTDKDKEVKYLFLKICVNQCNQCQKIYLHFFYHFIIIIDVRNNVLWRYNNLMPTVFRYKGFRFFFYSNEGNPLEPLHIHVMKGENTAKFWVEPQVSVAESYGMKPSELKAVGKVIENNKDLIRKVWDEYFN
jgi:hypothetical protein